MEDVFKKPCVICSRDCSWSEESKREDQLQKETGLLKLLSIESCVEGSKCNSDPFGVYCTDCQHRNSKIVKLYRKIDSLYSDLQELKKEIEKDFRNGFQNVPSSSSYSNGTEIEDREERYNFLRYQISKGLNVIDLHQESTNSYPENEDSFSGCVSEADSISSTFNHGENLLESLKQTYHLKDLKILVNRLPENEIPLNSSMKNNSRTLRKRKIKEPNPILTLSSSSEEEDEEDEEYEEEPAYKTRHQKTKRTKLRKSKLQTNKKPITLSKKPTLTCIFDDCEVDGSTLSFPTKCERDEHVKQVHGIDLSSEKETLDESKTLTNENSNTSSSVFNSSKPSESNKKNDDNAPDNEIQIISSTTSENRKTKSRVKSVKIGFKRKSNKRLLAQINKKGRLKCIFADCITRKRFRTEKERDKHLKKVHDFERTTATTKEKEVDEKGEDGDDDLDTSDSDDPNNQYPYARLQCPVEGCTNKRFWRSERQLAKHHKKAHAPTTTKNLHLCKECGRRFRFESEYNTHMDAHSGIFRFICQFCGKGFTSLGNLNVHLPKHTNERKWKCKVENCDATFKTNSGLKYHRLNTHEKYLAFKCEICEKMGIPDKRFMSSVKLNNHIKAVHIKERSHLCSYCGKGFTLKMYLASHMKIHKTEEMDEVKEKSRRKTKSINPSPQKSSDKEPSTFMTTTTQQPPISLMNATIPQSSASNINNNYGLPNFPLIQQSQFQPIPSQLQSHEYFQNYGQFDSHY